MIHPRHYGHDIRLPLDNGHTAIYRIPHGQEQAAMRTVLHDLGRQRLTDHEAALLMCGLNQITPSQPLSRTKRPSASARCCLMLAPVVAGLIDGLGRLIHGRE